MDRMPFSWRSVFLILCMPVFFYSCTTARPPAVPVMKPVVEPVVSPEPKPEAEPEVAPEVKPVKKTVENPVVKKSAVKKSVPTKPVVAPHADTAADSLSGLRVVGEVEPVTLVPSGVTMPARIDTGATTSSIDATEIEPFERDGEKWVRFVVADRRSGEKVSMQCPLLRRVNIISHAGESLKRPVVVIKTMMGGVAFDHEFSLTNRSDFSYQVLIGRNYLQGEFVVDVNRKNVTSPMSEN
ncbi:prokaryotic membrane lipoprotein lipid attachment site profile [Desulfoluna spongiiphila]|nr:prokaryotic membrane lipoprotein lipid attachment site profile [Desulfoluna spongiiphila]